MMLLKPWRKPTKSSLVGSALPLALLLGVGIMGAVRGGQVGSDIAWLSEMPQAQARAQHAARPLLLEFHTPGCEWCAKMEAETFADPRVIELARQFTCVRIDGETEPQLAQQYGVHEYPTTVFADESGHVLGRLPGYVPPADFAAVQSQALRLDKAQGHR